MGHFMAAKKNGVAVEEFGFGYPPRIFGIKKGDTIYSINWIPIGGFVKIKGESGENKNDKNSFASKAIWKRATILASGVGMNLALAAVLLAIGFYIGLPTIISDDMAAQNNVKGYKIQIMSILEESPAASADLQIGDTVKSINSQEFKQIAGLQEYNQDKAGQTITLTTLRGKKEVTQEITLIANESGEGIMGISLVETGIISYPWYQALWMGLKSTVLLVGQIIIAFYEIIRNLIVSQEVGAEVGGPVRIAVLTGQVTQMGFIYILQFTALLSINLAIINFLPFPALDGGRLLFLMIEKIRRRPVDQKIENLVHNIGFGLLILLMFVITFRDIAAYSDNIKTFLNQFF